MSTCESSVSKVAVEQPSRACKKFIDQEEGRKVKMLLNEQDFDGNNIYKTKNEAIVKLIAEKLRYHVSSSKNLVL